MTEAAQQYHDQLVSILERSVTSISTIKPSEWVEENVVMSKPFPGPFRYDRTPYTREIIDCLAPDHPCRVLAVMKGAQIGLSAGVIYAGMCWMIKNNPGNTFITVGAPDLIEKATEKFDLMIDGAGLRDYIRPSVQRNRAQRSGDTNTKKEFAGGYVTIASVNNHKALRQVDVQYGFFDDWESVKHSSKESGSTRKLVDQRFAAYADTRKQYFISTPERKAGSNIEAVYELGDQRKYLVPCPCDGCGAMIELKWTVPPAPASGRDFTGGITWKTDEAGKIIAGSVGYICQECGGFFTDQHKHEMLNLGQWVPTAEPSQPGYYSYHISSLYAPLGMFDWEHYVNDYIEANPVGQPRKEDLWMTFVNVVLGETYEETAEAPKANAIQKNTRNYEPFTIPEEQSIADGNGKIILLTLGSDMNGVVDDCRLDWEIVAWSETGANYSVAHGSIGTFIPRENTLKKKVDRERWTYQEHKPNSAWPELDKIMAAQYKTDTGREMSIYVGGLDCGHYSNYAYAYLDQTPHNVIGLKGTKEDEYLRFHIDAPQWTVARERSNLFIVKVGLVKDDLANAMELNWSQNDPSQPAGFMNFPQPSQGQYGFSNFFEHFESEHRVIVTNEEGKGTAARWVKKKSNSQNHMWDCRVYAMVSRDIAVALIGKEVGKPKLTWAEFIRILKGV